VRCIFIAAVPPRVDLESRCLRHGITGPAESDRDEQRQARTVGPAFHWRIQVGIKIIDLQLRHVGQERHPVPILVRAALDAHATQAEIVFRLLLLLRSQHQRHAPFAIGGSRQRPRATPAAPRQFVGVEVVEFVPVALQPLDAAGRDRIELCAEVAHERRNLLRLGLPLGGRSDAGEHGIHETLERERDHRDEQHRDDYFEEGECPGAPCLLVVLASVSSQIPCRGEYQNVRVRDCGTAPDFHVTSTVTS
jgi:hypothetical protein